MLLGRFHKMQFKRVVTHQEVGESDLPVEFLIPFQSFLPPPSTPVNDFESFNYVLRLLEKLKC